jgi:signal transduction histidine kinase
MPPNLTNRIAWVERVVSVEGLLTKDRAVRPGSWPAYLLAAAIVGAATAFHVALGPWLADNLFAIVFPAVVIASILCGAGAGLLALALSTTSVIVFLEAPGTFHRHLFILAMFVLFSSLTIAIISALRLTGQEARRAETLLTEAMEASDEGIAVFDAEDRLVLMNTAIKENPAGRRDLFVLGRTYEEILRIFLSGSEIENDKDLLEQFIAADVARHRRGDGTRTEHRVGEDAWIVNRDFRIRDVGVLHIATDVSAIVRAKEAAEQASLSKSRFLAAASHDLRQPLQTITLLQGLLHRTVSDARSQALVDKLGSSVDSMSDILYSLLELQQLEAGVVTPDLENFVIGDLLEKICFQLCLNAESKGLDLRWVRCGAVVRSDAKLLELILRNFLSNAIKYTNQGKILIGCRRSGNAMRIEVHDTGIGIAEDQLKVIFEEFRQIDNPARDRRKGLGLGLSIAQRLANLLGHVIDVRTVRHRGTAFSVEVPLGERTEPGSSPTAQSLESGEKLDILLVEDDPGVRWSLQAMLELLGHKVIAAEDGASALARLTDWRPDLIVSDFNLPGGMDGVELVKRARSQLGTLIRAVLLTGDVSRGPHAALSISDCVLLKKPADPTAIVAAARSFEAL